MLDLREAARDALEALERIGKDFVCRSAHHAKKDQHSAFAECPVVVRHTDAIESLRTALAQQGEQQPVAWYEYNQDLDAWFLAYGHNPKAKTRPLVFGDTAAPAPQPSQGAVTRRKIFVCAHCDGIYADQTVTQCDCMEGTGADFVEGFAEYPAALQSAHPVAQYDKTEMNAFVTDLYQRKSTDGQHGFYETMFHVVHKAIARVGIREVK